MRSTGWSGCIRRYRYLRVSPGKKDSMWSSGSRLGFCREEEVRGGAEGVLISNPLPASCHHACWWVFNHYPRIQRPSLAKRRREGRGVFFACARLLLAQFMRLTIEDAFYPFRDMVFGIVRPWNQVGLSGQTGKEISHHARNPEGVLEIEWRPRSGTLRTVMRGGCCQTCSLIDHASRSRESMNLAAGTAHAVLALVSSTFVSPCLSASLLCLPLRPGGTHSRRLFGSVARSP